MVNLHFPTNLTEEELMLQAKYEKLRKKKKALEIHKSPKVEAERPVIKRPKIEAKNAREIAKKLLKSGAIAAIPKMQRREEQGSGFKRPCGLERKIERNMNAAYQPFSSSLNELDNKQPVKKLYTTEELKDEVPAKTAKPLASNQPKPGNTIYVSVTKPSNQTLTEDFLSSTFSSCGKIINITLKAEKNHAFVTFDNIESATQAISTLNGTMIKNSFQLKITYAWRQPVFKSQTNYDSSQPIWSTPGVNQGSQKDSPTKDARNLVDYGVNYFSE